MRLGNGVVMLCGKDFCECGHEANHHYFFKSNNLTRCGRCLVEGVSYIHDFKEDFALNVERMRNANK